MLLQICRCSRRVSAVATLCAVLWLLKICSCATDPSDEALDKKQLTEFYSKLIHLCCCTSKDLLQNRLTLLIWVGFCYNSVGTRDKRVTWKHYISADSNIKIPSKFHSGLKL